MPDDSPKIEIQLEEGVSGLPREEWDVLVGDGSPFLEWGFLSALEDSGTLDESSGWMPKPLVAREEGRIVAACPLYVKTNSEGEFVFDYSWADASYRAGIDYYPKLLVGVPFSPVSGGRFLVRSDADRIAWIERLGGALRELCRGNELSSVHVNFCRPDEAQASKASISIPGSDSNTTGTTPATAISRTTWRRSGASAGTRCGANDARWGFKRSRSRPSRATRSRRT